MFRVLLFALLAIGGACAQNSQGGEAAPEPFSYSYETDTHSAAEQKDQNGRVTGYYTLADAADGRSRRVEYYADESGFHAKVQTNEVGTESKNSADVEVFASPPTREQFSYQPPVSQPQPPKFAVAQQQQQQQAAFVATSQPARAQTVSYVQQPGYAYNSYGYYPAAYGQYGYNNPSGYNSQYNTYASYPGYGYGSYGAYGGYGGASSQFGARSSSVAVQPSSYSTGSVAKYTASSPVSVSGSVPVVGAAGATGSSYKASTTYQAVGVPASGVGYQAVGVPASGVGYQAVGVPASGVGYQAVGVPASGAGYQASFVGPQRTSYSRVSSGYSSSSAPVGSSNYIVLKKRDVENEV